MIENARINIRIEIVVGNINEISQYSDCEICPETSSQRYYCLFSSSPNLVVARDDAKVNDPVDDVVAYSAPIIETHNKR